MCQIKKMQSWKQQPGQATVFNGLQKQEKSKKDKEKYANVTVHSIHAKPDASSPQSNP